MNGEIHCLYCSIATKKQYLDAQKAGTLSDEMLFLDPKPAYTWTVELFQGLPVAIPICLEHLRPASSLVITP